MMEQRVGKITPSHATFICLLGLTELFRIDSLDKFTLCNQYCTVNLCLLCRFKIWLEFRLKNKGAFLSAVLNSLVLSRTLIVTL